MSANPFIVPEAFDRVFLGGELLPGLASVGRVKRIMKWDKKEGPGTSGDSITYRGKRLVDFVIDLKMWDVDQITDWDNTQPSLEIDGKSYDIVHPILERLKVRSVVIAELPGLFHEGGGLWSVQIGVNEFKPPAKGGNSTVTPKGSSNSTGKDGPGAAAKPTTAKSAQEEEIEKLLKIAKEP